MPERMTQPTHTQIHADLAAQMRRLAQSIRQAGGFDPNGDPVIIGNGAGVESNDGPGVGQIAIGLRATVGDSSFGIGNYNTAIGDGAIAGGAADDDDSNTAVGANTAASGGGAAAFGGANAQAVHAVAVGNADATGDSSIAVGQLAHATADHAIAIGEGAIALPSGAVAIGWNATTTGSSENAVAIGADSQSEGGDSVAVGHAALALADGAVALGDSSSATHVFGTALGAGAGALHDYATAVGNGVVTTAAHQIMLGTDLGFVEIPGDSSAAPNGLVLTDTDGSGNRWIAQVTGGAWALSAAP